MVQPGVVPAVPAPLVVHLSPSRVTASIQPPLLADHAAADRVGQTVPEWIAAVDADPEGRPRALLRPRHIAREVQQERRLDVVFQAVVLHARRRRDERREGDQRDAKGEPPAHGQNRNVARVKMARCSRVRRTELGEMNSK